MELWMYDTAQRAYRPQQVQELTWTEATDAACAALCFTYKCTQPIGEIVRVTAAENGKLFFNGYCDCQRWSKDANGQSYFIYARSAACLLVDSRAKPFTFTHPTARQLWAQYAREKGFGYALGEIGCKAQYAVTSGSCWGAIQSFVFAQTGQDIYVTTDNVLALRTTPQTVQSLDGCTVLAARETVNRSEPLAQIHYKREGDLAYNAHLVSRYAAAQGLTAETYLNVSALPAWQREHTVRQKLAARFENYKTLELTLAGRFDGALGALYRYTGADGMAHSYRLTQRQYTVGPAGERSRLTLKRSMDLEERMYVD